MKLFKNKLLIFSLLSVTLILILAPIASSSPDGLEWVAEVKGFLHRGEANPTYFKFAPMSDYAISSIKNPTFSTIASGLIGLFLTMGLSFVFFKLIQKKKH